MVHGVHFSNAIAWRDVGWKIVAVNVSDIAAMGGTPTYGLITLGVAPSLTGESLEELYEGVAVASLRYGLTIAGGDVVEAAQAFVTLTLFGESATDSSGRPLLMLRSAAHPGDVIAVTGRLGDSAAGLRLLADQGRRTEAKYAVLVQAHVRPEPRIEVGRNAVNRGVRCAIDVSDGLLQDIGHICEASGVAALLHTEQLPVSESLRSAFPGDAVSLAATGGEDYELVLVAKRNVLDEVTKVSDVPITVVGEMTIGAAGDVRLIGARGDDITPAVGGWDHLRSAR
jgi:thiamine-monophosphate kinase